MKLETLEKRSTSILVFSHRKKKKNVKRTKPSLQKKSTTVVLFVNSLPLKNLICCEKNWI